jgi:suppressor of ftsI
METLDMSACFRRFGAGPVAARAAGVVVAFAAALLVGPLPVHATELPRPPEVLSEHGVATLTLVAIGNGKTHLPEYWFNGQRTPPTIRVNPGDHIKLTLVNALPTVMGQDFKNMTNLHYHGMKTSPNEPADDVIDVMLMPGQRYAYDVPIPKDESPGLYYYHPHPHGESNRQVSGGMTGAIIVNGIEKYYPQVAQVPERLVIIRDVYPPYYPVPAILRAPAGRTRPDTSGPTCTGQGTENITVNGETRPTISIRPGETQYWRVANTSANTFVDLQMDGAKLNVIARDGEPIVYRDQKGGGVTYSHFLLAPANRVEFFVTGSSLAHPKLRSLCVDAGPVGHIDPARVLADINPLGTGGEALVPGPATLVPTHKPAADIRSMPVAAKKTIVFTEDQSDGYYYINGELYDPSKPPHYFAKSGTVEEWTVVNKTQELHAFHIHQIHFLVEDQSPPGAPADYRDTITVPYEKTVNGKVVPGTVHLLMDFSDPIIKGTFVFHCHILEHEDGGMMQKITVR